MATGFGQSRLVNFLAPASMARSAWVEAPLVMVLTMLLAWLIRPDDPLVLQGGIRWTLVAALVVSLRYGSLAGGLSMLTLLVAWKLCKAMGFYPGMAFPEMVFLGGFIIVLITGEFSDIWRVRLRRAESESVYAVERLRSLTQRHALLRLSHDRLEENLLTRPYTIRDVLLRMRDLAMAESRERRLPAAEDLLHLLGEYCQLQRGALYAVHQGRVNPTAVAMLGENRELDPRDTLLRFALDNGVLSHVQMAEQDGTYTGDYWVCAPVSNSTGEVIAVLTVQRMPFLSLNHENLQLMAVLLNFYADIVQHAPEVDHLCTRWPSLPPALARELTALSLLAADRRVDTTLMLLVADGSQQAGQILEALHRGRRNLDSAWWLDPSRHRLMLSMPMTGSAGFESFVMRTEQWLQDEYAFMSLAQAGIRFVHASLTGQPVEQQLQELIEAVDHV